MKYDFDRIIDRRGTLSHKWDNMAYEFPDNPDALPFWVADTDFACPEPIVKALMDRASHPIYGYSDWSDRTQTLAANWKKKRDGWEVDPGWITFSNGVVPALSAMVEAYTEPGDGVIIQPPVYYPFRESVENNGRIVRENPLVYDEEKWNINFEELEELAAEPGTKLFLLCHPLNPVSRVLEREELIKIAEICEKNHVILAVDEIHSDLVFPHKKFYSLASLDRRYEEFTITAMAPSKTFNVAGLQMSALIIPNQELRERFEKVMARRVYIPNLFGVVAFDAAYGNPECEEYLEQLLDYLWGNYLFVDEFLKNHMPGIKCQKPDATYLLWMDFRELGLDDRELADFCLKEGNVALDGGVWFGKGGSGFMRMNIGCPRSLVKKGLEQLQAAYIKRKF